MHTEPAVPKGRGARSARLPRPLATVSGAVEVFAIELPRLRMSPSVLRLGVRVANYLHVIKLVTYRGVGV